MDDLDQHIKFEVCYTPQNWQTLYNTHPGSGLPSVLLPARLTAERILRDAGVPPAAYQLKPTTA